MLKIPLLFSFHFGFAFCRPIAHLIAEEILGPIRDIAVLVHVEPFNFGGAVVDLAEIEYRISRRNIFLSDASLHTTQQILAVGLKDNLNIPIFHNINEDIRQIRLCFRMQMCLRLFEDED